MDLSAIAVLYQDSPEKETLIWYLRKLGMDHVLFGSDFPVFTSEKTLAAIRQYGLSKRVNSSSPAMEIEKWPVQSQQLTDVKRTLGYATQPYFHARWCAVKAHDVWSRNKKIGQGVDFSIYVSGASTVQTHVIPVRPSHSFSYGCPGVGAPVLSVEEV